MAPNGRIPAINVLKIKQNINVQPTQVQNTSILQYQCHLTRWFSIWYFKDNQVTRRKVPGTTVVQAPVVEFDWFELGARTAASWSQSNTLGSWAVVRFQTTYTAVQPSYQMGPMKTTKRKFNSITINLCWNKLPGFTVYCKKTIQIVPTYSTRWVFSPDEKVQEERDSKH